MRPFKTTISLEEARRRLDAGVRPIERTERIALGEAAGRVAAADVRAGVFVPPFARSAMDGYAVIAADTRGATRDRPVRLGIGERIYTGQPTRARRHRHLCGDRDRRAPARWGRRRRHGRGNRAGRRERRRHPCRGGGRSERRTPRRGYLAGRRSGPRRRCAERGPHRGAGCRRMLQLEVYERPRVAVLSTATRWWSRARSWDRADPRRQPVHARGRDRRQRRRPRAASARPTTPSRRSARRSMAARAPT